MASEGSVVIKKIKKGDHGGHHGGAWKVAYADFVTAMMAFFLLMWLINTTTPEQKRGIADYFAPESVSRSQSGSGSIFGGTVAASQGQKGAGQLAVTMQLKPPAPEQTSQRQSTANSVANAESSASGKADQDSESHAFEQAAARLRQALQDMPDLLELSKHVLIDQTPEGMRIQLVDQDGRSMFEPGRAEPTERVQKLLQEVAKVINTLPNRISISGHTDGAPFTGPNGFTNWELSAARANTARRILEQSGVAEDRIAQVVGKAGSEPLYPDNPIASANRRISIVLMREAPVLPPGFDN
ncbi:MAG: flagellar motor protein MotB [Alphaproteobacteria bacterium]|nr:flagellar motor protein MotB [Alphaproteobacteria bacterium]